MSIDWSKLSEITYDQIDSAQKAIKHELKNRDPLQEEGTYGFQTEKDPEIL